MTAMEKERSSTDDEVDYKPLLGFATPVVRIDPHTRDVVPPAGSDLRKAIEIIRRKSDSRADDIGRAAATSK